MRQNAALCGFELTITCDITTAVVTIPTFENVHFTNSV